jgi:hypothetical protein
MTDFLLIVQSVLLILLLIAIGMLAARLQTTSKKVEGLIDQVERAVREDIKPTLAEARDAIKNIDQAASGAARAIQAAEPLVSTASKVAGVFQKSATSIWFDAFNLVVRIYQAVRSPGEKNPEQHKTISGSKEN